MHPFLIWLDEQNTRCAYEYRLALWREISHVKRIFNVITPDVREMLLKGLKEIQQPSVGKYPGNDASMDLYKSAPKVDFENILNEAIKTI